jgi:hypothetical protein
MNLPTFTDFSLAGMSLVNRIRAGTLATTPQASFNDAWVCEGFLGSFLPVGGLTAALVATPLLTDDEFANQLEAACNGTHAAMQAGAGWLALLLKVLALLAQLFPTGA